MKDRRKEIDNERSQLEGEVRKFEQIAKDDKRLWRRTSFAGARLVDRSRCWEACVENQIFLLSEDFIGWGRNSRRYFGKSRLMGP